MEQANAEVRTYTCDTVDTGQYGARKKAQSSEKERDKVFANFRKRTQHGYKLNQNQEVPMEQANNIQQSNAEVRTYTCVHVRKGKVVVEAKTTYAAAVEASNIWRLKTGTSGIDVYPHT